MTEPAAAGPARQRPGRPSQHTPDLPVGTGRLLLLITAGVQAVTPGLIRFDGAPNDPPVVPAGYAFAVWGVILALCLASAVRYFPVARAASPPLCVVHGRLSAVQVLFVVWLLAAGSDRYVAVTVPVFALMAWLTIACMRRAREAPPLLRITLGVYAGWCSVAVWVNAATLLPEVGVSLAGRPGDGWQALALIGAGLTAGVVMSVLHAPLPYVATVAWALVGVLVSVLAAGRTPLVAIVVLAVVALAAVAVRARRSGAPRHPALPA